MRAHVNGWRTIERQLFQLGKKQGEIAQLLGITPAAVSQVKKGIFLLNPKQLEKIAVFLQFDGAMRSEFYTELFNARLLERDAGHADRDSCYRVCRDWQDVKIRNERVIPLGDMSLLTGYVSSLETMRSYLLRKSPERYLGRVSGVGICALRVDTELENAGVTSGSHIVIESGSYPESGALSLVGMRDGRYLLREFFQESDRIVLRPMLSETGNELVMKRAEVSDILLWLHPVLELTLRFFS